MTYHTTGSRRGPAGQSRAPRLAAAILVVGVVAAVVALVVGFTTSAGAANPDDTENGIFCGVPLAQHLAVDATNTYRASLLAGTVVSTDIIAPANDGFLKLQSLGFTPATETCQLNLLLTVPPPPQGQGDVVGVINVRDCNIPPNPPRARDYTLTMSVVSSGPDNCAVPLPCGMPLNGSFNIAGEVDSYTFPGTQGDTVTFSVTNSTVQLVRVRLFDPAGNKLYDGADSACAASFQTQLPTSGSYTALLSKCTGAATGSYTVTWQPSTSCTPKQPANQFAYVTNADSGTMSVIDLSTNTAKLTLPITSAGRVELASPTFVDVTPNGGFAWATYGPSSAASVVNTSTNLLVASVPTGIDANGVTIDPDGSLAYVVSNSLGGIALVNTKTNKVARLVSLEQDLGFLQGIQAVATQDGTFLYVASEDASGLAKINTTDYALENVAGYNIGIYDAFAVSPDGSFAYAGTLDGIAVIDTNVMMQTGEIPNVGEPFGIAFSFDGRTAYATLPDTPDPNDPKCNDPQNPQPCSGTVALINTTTSQVTAIVTDVGDSPGGVAISPETGLVYVTDLTAAATQPGVFIIDPNTKKVIASTPTLGDGPTGIALTTAPTGLCVGDALGECKVTVDELVLSVNYLLNGCPGRFPSVSVPFP